MINWFDSFTGRRRPLPLEEEGTYLLARPPITKDDTSSNLWVALLYPAALAVKPAIVLLLAVAAQLNWL